MQLKDIRPQKRNVICLFVLDGIDSLPDIPGRRIDREIINMVCDHIVRHFEAAGGIFIRKNRKEFITILPDYDLDNAARIIEGFKSELNKKGMGVMDDYACIAPGLRFNWSISVGLAEYGDDDDIHSIPASTKSELITIAIFSCDPGRR